MKKLLIALLAIFVSLTGFAQKISVTGVVTDEQRVPVIGASVIEKGTSNGIVTDINGHFSISVKRGATIVFSSIGYKTLESKATNTMTVVLLENNQLLDEVVVIGYGSVKRKDVTTAVSSVSTKDLGERPLISVSQAIQGKAAGISVSSPNGMPGAGMTIRVRGTTSMNGSNDPLYVIDGVPTTDISYLSPDDIASIQILKDASSAAISGSRAANGVIMVTTKTGEAGVAKISFNAHFGFNKIQNKIKPLNAAQYKDLQDEIGLVSLPSNLTDKTNWFDEIYRTGTSQNYQLSITNGNDKMNYYISGGYTGENGVIDYSGYKRYNFRASLNNQIKSWLKISADVSYADMASKGDIISGTGSNRGGVVLAVINTPTYAPVWDPANPKQYYTNFYGVNITSPSENVARQKDNKTTSDRLLATGKALITFMPGFTFSSSMTLDRGYEKVFNFLDPIATTNGRENYGTGYDQRSLNTILTFDNILSYNKQFGKHGLDVMAGSSWTSSKWSESWINASHYANGYIKTLNAANEISWTGTGTSESEWAIMSYMGRLAYNYDSKYLVTANLRADGSSKLAPGHRWGVFPSFSGAWRISSENFMKNLTWIDDIKILGGWGQTGNQSGLGDYSYLAAYNISRIAWFTTGNNNAVPNTTDQSTLSNPDLTWETTSQTDLGLDLTILRNRLTFAMDYYYKKTTNMLMTVSLPTGSAPANTFTRNEGTMTNRGFEFSIDSRNLVGAFKWETNFNISFNKNKLKKLELSKIYYDAKTTDQVSDYVVRNEPGRPLGCFWGYISDGVDPETGELKYRDTNHDGVVSASDRTYIGDPNPDFTYGMSNTFSYRGINLSVLLQGSYGNDIYNVSRMETEGMYDGKNQSTRVLNRWRIPGQITNIPKAGFDMKNSSYFVENGSYLRVKNITLSYDIKNSLLRKWGITKLLPYVTFNNLITWTKYKGMDPEVNQYGNSGTVQGVDYGTYPQSKSFLLGLNIEF